MRRGIVLSAALVALLATTLWATARSTAESLTRPRVPAAAAAPVRGAAAFEGAGFGGIGMDALSSNAVP